MNVHFRVAMRAFTALQVHAAIADVQAVGNGLGAARRFIHEASGNTLSCGNLLLSRSMKTILHLTRALLLAFTSLTLLAAVAQAETVSQLWATRFNGPANGSDRARAVAVDFTGNIAVTGTSSNTASIGSDYDIYTAKYAADGSLIWAVRYDGPAHGDDGGVAVGCAPNGDVVITGYTGAANGFHDIYTAKYRAADGLLLWERIYSGTGNHHDEATALAVDNGGNVFITGFAYNTGTFTDYYTAKYDSADGHIIWERTYAGSGQDQARAITINILGVATVTGSSYDPVNGNDYYTIRYNSGGDQVWAVRYNGPANASGGDFATAIAEDLTYGHAVVTGYSTGASGSDDIYTAEYDNTDGHLLWERRYNGPGNGTDKGLAIAVENTAGYGGGVGSVFITGTSYGSSGSADIYTARYRGTDGAVQWEQRYDSGSLEVGTSLVLDSVNHVYVAGYTYSGPNGDYYLAKYDAATGAQHWATTYGASGGSTDLLTEGRKQLALNIPYVIVTGYSTGSGTNDDYATIKFAQSGSPDIAVAQAGAAADGGSVDFGTVTLGSSSAAKTFTITNPGTADLTSLAVTGGTSEFAVSALSATSIPVGSGTATFSVIFSPTSTGPRGTTLHIASNVTGTKNPYDIVLNGTGQSIFAAWAAFYGVANDPNALGANGLKNLLNFASGLPPVTGGAGELQYTGTLAGGGTLTAPGLPKLWLEPGGNGVDFWMLFVRRKDAALAGLTYSPEFTNAGLSTWETSAVTPTVLADNGTHEIVGVPYPPFVAGQQTRFSRIRVTLAP